MDYITVDGYKRLVDEQIITDTHMIKLIDNIDRLDTEREKIEKIHICVKIDWMMGSN